MSKEISLSPLNVIIKDNELIFTVPANTLKSLTKTKSKKPILYWAVIDNTIQITANSQALSIPMIDENAMNSFVPQS